MAHAWVDVTYLEQEDFDRLVAERKARSREKVMLLKRESLPRDLIDRLTRDLEKDQEDTPGARARSLPAVLLGTGPVQPVDLRAG